MEISLLRKKNFLDEVLSVANTRSPITETAVTKSDIAIYSDSVKNRTEGQSEYVYSSNLIGKPWQNLSTKEQLDEWIAVFKKLKLFFSTDNSTESNTPPEVYSMAAAAIISQPKYSTILPFEIERYLLFNPKEVAGKKKEFVSYTVTFFTNIVEDYRIGRALVKEAFERAKDNIKNEMLMLKEAEQDKEKIDLSSIGSFDTLLFFQVEKIYKDYIKDTALEVENKSDASTYAIKEIRKEAENLILKREFSEGRKIITSLNRAVFISETENGVNVKIDKNSDIFGKFMRHYKIFLTKTFLSNGKEKSNNATVN